MQYDPMYDSPEAKAFNEAVEFDLALNKETLQWIEENTVEGQTHVVLPADLHARLIESSRKLMEAYHAYMAVIGEDVPDPVQYGVTDISQ